VARDGMSILRKGRMDCQLVIELALVIWYICAITRPRKLIDRRRVHMSCFQILLVDQSGLAFLEPGSLASLTNKTKVYGDTIGRDKTCGLVYACARLQS
jgi:hypothetical protein